MSAGIKLGSGIRYVSPLEPSYSQVIAYARETDADGFLRWLASQADDYDLGDLVDEYARNELEGICEYLTMCEV